MTSHIPLALSVLGAIANAYPLTSMTQKTTPPPPPPPLPPTAPSSIQAPLVALPAKTQAVNIPGGLPSGNASSAANNVGTSPPTANLAALCEVCQLRPKHFDGNKTHLYCSKTCANKKLNSVAGSNGSGSVTSNSGGNCIFCHNRPKFVDGTKTHDYCSKACAKNASPQRKGTTGKSSQATGSIASQPTNIPSLTPPLPASASSVCQAPGCSNPPHSGHDYCSVAHKNLGENLCLMCLQAPKMAHSHFCSQTCADDAESKGPMILEVPYGHSTFKSVSDQFKASWRHVGTSCPPVRNVYKIVTPKTELASYNAYKAAVESRGQFASSGRSEGNENRRWHGTRRICNLGDKGQNQFCSSQSCSLCNIIRTSYDISLWGKKTGWGRFGKGIYTSSTSSKSNDYSHNDCKSNLKAILLNKVIVGKGCKMLQDHTTLTAPPSGYDSVLAEKGGSLNYDELVVYNNDAIRPSFLVMYDA